MAESAANVDSTISSLDEQRQPSLYRAHLHLLQESTISYGQYSTDLAWRLSNELDIAQPTHQSLPQLSQT